MRSLLRLLVMGVALVGCGPMIPSELGRFVVDDSFVAWDEWIYFAPKNGGISTVSLSGGRPTEVVPPGFLVMDVSTDRQFWVLTNANTDLYFRTRSGQLLEVPELSGRVGSAALSPDGKTVAVIRHADFSVAPSEWSETNEVVLIDTEFLTVSTIRSTKKTIPTDVRWTHDGAQISLSLLQTAELIDPVSHRRSSVRLGGMKLREKPNERRPHSCNGRDLVLLGAKGAEGLAVRDLVDRSERAIVSFEPASTDPYGIPTYFFSDTCQVVVFEYNLSIWVADITGSRVHLLGRGIDPFLPL